MAELRVIWAVFNHRGERLYKGDNSFEAENIAAENSLEYRTKLKSYHNLTNHVCINEILFEDGEKAEKTMYYVPKSEIEILVEIKE